MPTMSCPLCNEEMPTGGAEGHYKRVHKLPRSATSFREFTSCPECGTVLQVQTIRRHLEQQHDYDVKRAFLTSRELKPAAPTSENKAGRKRRRPQALVPTGDVDALLEAIVEASTGDKRVPLGLMTSVLDLRDSLQRWMSKAQIWAQINEDAEEPNES